MLNIKTVTIICQDSVSLLHLNLFRALFAHPDLNNIQRSLLHRWWRLASLLLSCFPLALFFSSSSVFASYIHTCIYTHKCANSRALSPSVSICQSLSALPVDMIAVFLFTLSHSVLLSLVHVHTYVFFISPVLLPPGHTNAHAHTLFPLISHLFLGPHSIAPPFCHEIYAHTRRLPSLLSLIIFHNHTQTLSLSHIHTHTHTAQWCSCPIIITPTWWTERIFLFSFFYFVGGKDTNPHLDQHFLSHIHTRLQWMPPLCKKRPSWKHDVIPSSHIPPSLRLCPPSPSIYPHKSQWEGGIFNQKRKKDGSINLATPAVIMHGSLFVCVYICLHVRMRFVCRHTHTVCVCVWVCLFV